MISNIKMIPLMVCETLPKIYVIYFLFKKVSKISKSLQNYQKRVTFIESSGSPSCES